MPDQGEQNNDRDRNSQKHQQYCTTHRFLLIFTRRLNETVESLVPIADHRLKARRADPGRNRRRGRAFQSRANAITMQPMNTLCRPAILGVAACLVGCASSGSSVEVSSQASGSAYFSLSRPGVYKVRDGLEIAGRVCRRARTTLLSPPRVRLEHLATDGATLDVAHAGVAAIYRNPENACTDYAARVAWTIADGESVRACLDRGRPCPADPAMKAVIAVPGTAAKSP